MSRREWYRYLSRRLEHLRRWRIYAELVARSCRKVLGDRCVEVYVVGGVAEERITVLSDIDIVVIVDDPKLKTIENIAAIKTTSRELGVPEEVPIDVKIHTLEEFREASNSLYRRRIKIL